MASTPYGWNYYHVPAPSVVCGPKDKISPYVHADTTILPLSQCQSGTPPNYFSFWDCVGRQRGPVVSGWLNANIFPERPQCPPHEIAARSHPLPPTMARPPRR